MKLGINYWKKIAKSTNTWRQNNKPLKGKKNLSRKNSENMSNQRKMETQLSKTYSIEHKHF